MCAAIADAVLDHVVARHIGHAHRHSIPDDVATMFEACTAHCKEGLTTGADLHRGSLANL